MSTENSPAKDPLRWEQRYREGDLPWDSGRPDPHLLAVMEAYGLASGKALEIGCGTGTNAIWLEGAGLDVVGVDLSPTAIERARAKAAAAGAGCRFLTTDFLVEDVPGGPFDLVYDRGCFHVFDEVDVRAHFVARVASLLAPEGVWHSMIGSTDGPPREVGPPRRSLVDIASAVEPHFELLEMRSTTFDNDHINYARAWVMVARKRAG